LSSKLRLIWASVINITLESSDYVVSTLDVHYGIPEFTLKLGSSSFNRFEFAKDLVLGLRFFLGGGLAGLVVCFGLFRGKLDNFIFRISLILGQVNIYGQSGWLIPRIKRMLSLLSINQLDFFFFDYCLRLDRFNGLLFEKSCVFVAVRISTIVVFVSLV